MRTNFRPLIFVLIAVGVVQGETPREWGKYVSNCCDTLIERGTDVYGPEKTPLLMSVIDVRTMDSPEKPELVDSLIRFEGRVHRRSERGANLWNDQPTLRAMYRLSRLGGDKKYADAADAYMEYALAHCRKENGMLVWGSHIHWDCYRDRAGGDQDGRGPHEILVFLPLWEEMYRLNPEMVRTEAELIWKWHIHDKEQGRHNRHDDGRPGVDFPFSAGSFVSAFAFMNSVTPDDREWLRRARLVTDWHWDHRHPVTNLVPFIPSKKDSLYGRTSASAVSGPYAVSLLRAYELTKDAHFRDVALACLGAYNKYGWDEEARTYLGMLNLDGTPTTPEQVPGDMRSQLAGGEKEPDPEYSVPPLGPVDVWPTTLFPLDFPLLGAQANLYAYEIAKKDGKGDEDLLRAAKRWAAVIEANLPPDTGWTFRKTFEKALPKVRQTKGTYAQNYGRAISFFVHLYRATGEKHYLAVAEQLAAEAVDKLYVETEITLDSGRTKTYGLFRGHPAKPYYEAANGVGILLLALLELDRPDEPSLGAF